MREERFRRRLLDDMTVIQEDDPVGDGSREGHLMRDDQHGQPLLRELEHNVEHLANHLRVQRRGDLIEEHHLRMHLKGPHDRHTLLLSTGQHTRIGVFLVAESDAPEQLAGLLLRVRLRTLLHLLRCHRDVVEDRFMWEKIIALEHHADLLPVL